MNSLNKAYGDECLSDCRIRFWFNSFSKGRNVVLDLPRSGRRRSGQSAENIKRVKELVQKDKRVTVKAIETQLQIPHSTVHDILRKDLQLRRRAAKFVPRLLTPAHLMQCFDCCSTMLRCVHRHPGLLKEIITMDEAWVYTYDPELKAQSSQWLTKNEPQPVKGKRTRAVGKSLLIVFFDWRGVVHREFLRNRSHFQSLHSNAQPAARCHPSETSTPALGAPHGQCPGTQCKEHKAAHAVHRNAADQAPALLARLGPFGLSVFLQSQEELEGQTF